MYTPPQLPSQPSKPSFMQTTIAVPLWTLLTCGVVVSCMGCGLLGLIGASAKTPSTPSTQMHVRLPTNTPGPTPTPKPTATPQPTATPKPTPSPTRTPQWTTINHFGGTANQQTDTFHLSDGAHIAWSYQISYSANYFAVTLYASDGTYVDTLANYANQGSGQQSTYTVHGAVDGYLKIESDHASWTVDVQVYK